MYTFLMQTAHSSHQKFEKLVTLVVYSGGKDLEVFVQRGARNVFYTSFDAVTDL